MPNGASHRKQSVVRWVILPVLFLATCGGLLPVGMRIADPMTNVAPDPARSTRFPVLVFHGDRHQRLTVDTSQPIPALSPGSSYLVPLGAEKTVKRSLAGESWRLHVERPAPGRQLIELYHVDDGYRGAAYEATASTVKLRSLKITGPGFAFVFGGLALLMNLALWGIAALVIRRFGGRTSGSPPDMMSGGNGRDGRPTS